MSLGGAVVAAIGAFLPWFTINVFGTSGSVSGLSRDGIFTLALACIAGGVAFFRWGRAARIVVGLAGVIVFVLGAMYIADPLIGVPASELRVSRQAARTALQPGSGLYATALGGGLILGGVVTRYTS